MPKPTTQSLISAKKRSLAINAERRKKSQKVQERSKKACKLAANKKAVQQLIVPSVPVALEAPVEGTAGTATASRIIAYAGATDLPQVALSYNALCGAARPVSKAIASDCVAVADLKSAIAADLKEEFAKHPTRFGIQMARRRIVSGIAVAITLDELKKAHALCKRLTVNGISTIRNCPVPQEESSIPGIALDLVSLTWGPDVYRSPLGSRRRTRMADSFDRSYTKYFEPDDPAGIDTVMGIMFPKSMIRLPPPEPEVDDFGKFNSDPGYRAFLTLMVRAQMQLSRMLIGHGAGQAIIRRALTAVDAALARRCESAPEILCFDGIVHFLNAEVRRLRLDDVIVPFIRLR